MTVFMMRVEKLGKGSVVEVEEDVRDQKLHSGVLIEDPVGCEVSPT